jgi:hypothetical protein
VALGAAEGVGVGKGWIGKQSRREWLGKSLDYGLGTSGNLIVRGGWLAWAACP